LVNRTNHHFEERVGNFRFQSAREHRKGQNKDNKNWGNKNTKGWCKSARPNYENWLLDLNWTIQWTANTLKKYSRKERITSNLQIFQYLINSIAMLRDTTQKDNWKGSKQMKLKGSSRRKKKMIFLYSRRLRKDCSALCKILHKENLMPKINNNMILQQEEKCLSLILNSAKALTFLTSKVPAR